MATTTPTRHTLWSIQNTLRNERNALAEANRQRGTALTEAIAVINAGQADRATLADLDVPSTILDAACAWITAQAVRGTVGDAHQWARAQAVEATRTLLGASEHDADLEDLCRSIEDTMDAHERARAARAAQG